MKYCLLVAAFVLQSAVAFAAGDIVVRDAWIRAAPPKASVLAGYFTLENRSGQLKALVGGQSPAFERVTLHRSDMSDGMAQMHAMERVTVASHAVVHFQPGGYHLMLEEPKRPLHPGDKVPFELKFRDGSRLEAAFTVRDERAAHEHH